MPLRLPGGVTPPTFRFTQYVESDGSPEGNYYLDRGQIARRIQVDWPARKQAVLDFGGSATVLNNGTVRYISRTLPHTFPGKRWMAVQSIPKEEGMGLRGCEEVDGEILPAYDLCELTLVYVMPTFKLLGDDGVTNADAGDDWYGLPDEGWALSNGHANSRYVTKLPRYSSKTLVLNRGLLKTAPATGAPKPIPEGIPFPQAGGEIVYTWHQVPEEGVPYVAIRTLGNGVNDATFDGYPAGTLLYEGNAEIRPTPNPMTGQVLCDVTYRFSVSLKVDPVWGTVYGHNHIWRVANNENPPVLRPEPVTTDGVGTDPGTVVFRPVSFRRFFRPDPL